MDEPVKTGRSHLPKDERGANYREQTLVSRLGGCRQAVSGLPQQNGHIVIHFEDNIAAALTHDASAWHLDIVVVRIIYLHKVEEFDLHFDQDG
jgi:hypothetical protein